MKKFPYLTLAETGAGRLITSKLAAEGAESHVFDVGHIMAPVTTIEDCCTFLNPLMKYEFSCVSDASAKPTRK